MEPKQDHVQSAQIPDSLGRLVEAGKFGRKSGEGYYRWDGDKKVDD